MARVAVLVSVMTVLGTDAQVAHRDFDFTGCSDTVKEDVKGFDDEEEWHADFIRREGVVTGPDFAEVLNFTEVYANAVNNIDVCEKNLEKLIQHYKSVDERLDSPDSSIFSKLDVVLGEENALVCHVTGFFPPPVNVSWTKNNEIVTEGTSLSQYRPMSDGTFNIFSTLKFLPAEGDIYSCTVTHKSIPGQARTKTWDAEVAVSAVGPSVFCGLGLSLGLLGVAAGTFFLIKGIKSC